MNKTKLSFTLATLTLLVSASVFGATLKVGTKGDGSQYDKTKLTVKAGEKVTLIFKSGAAKDSGLQHSWILVQPGKEADVAQAGISAGADKGYIPESSDIIAHTQLLNAGESETIQFTAPAAPGNYPYICTFPGHYPMMKGVLIVKK